MFNYVIEIRKKSYYGLYHDENVKFWDWTGWKLEALLHISFDLLQIFLIECLKKDTLYYRKALFLE